MSLVSAAATTGQQGWLYSAPFAALLGAIGVTVAATITYMAAGRVATRELHNRLAEKSYDDRREVYQKALAGILSDLNSIEVDKSLAAGPHEFLNGLLSDFELIASASATRYLRYYLRIARAERTRYLGYEEDGLYNEYEVGDKAKGLTTALNLLQEAIKQDFPRVKL